MAVVYLLAFSFFSAFLSSCSPPILAVVFLVFCNLRADNEDIMSRTIAERLNVLAADLICNDFTTSGIKSEKNNYVSAHIICDICDMVSIINYIGINLINYNLLYNMI